MSKTKSSTTKKPGSSHNRAIAVRPPQEPPQEPSMALILQEVVNRGITSENVGTVKEMVALYERMKDRDAEQKFAVAFNALLKEIPAIKATKPVAGKDGTVRY